MTKSSDSSRAMADECLCLRARKFSRTLSRLYDEALRPIGIQATQLSLLNAIALMGEEGAAMARLADVLAMDRTTLSRNLRPLERSGLVRVARSPFDARVRFVLLTPMGRRALDQGLPLWAGAQKQVRAALGPEVARGLRRRLDAATAATVTLARSREE
jgi:DNA-binding MarR family transcriptional regulator